MHLNLSLPKYQKMVALQEFNGQWNEIENFGEMIVCCTLQLLLLLMMCLVMHKALQLSSVDKMCTVTTASNWTAWSWQMIQKTTRNFQWRFSSVLQDRFTLSTEICSLFIIWDRCESFLSDDYGLWLNYKCRRISNKNEQNHWKVPDYWTFLSEFLWSEICSIWCQISFDNKRNTENLFHKLNYNFLCIDQCIKQFSLD